MHAFLAEHRHRLFSDSLFADLFPTNRGRPSSPLMWSRRWWCFKRRKANPIGKRVGRCSHQVQLSFPDLDLGDVATPRHVRCRRIEVPVERRLRAPM